MFKAFDVTDIVSYGTFSEISEKLINEKGDLRTIVANLFGHNGLMKKKAIPPEKISCGKVLLVYEVDTFFSKDFYGNTYNPCAIILND